MPMPAAHLIRGQRGKCELSAWLALLCMLRKDNTCCARCMLLVQLHFVTTHCNIALNITS